MQVEQAFQTTLDQGIPLSDVTFCVVDLETTGGSPRDSKITEIGAVKVRGGVVLGEFQALVDPQSYIPSFITHLTGISNAMVADAPPIEAIMPAFLEFARDMVFVAHNAQFDFSFVQAELIRLDYEPLTPPAVCTARLARRVVWQDVPNVKLATLAQYFRVGVQPTHRALADAQACNEVLHALLELGGRLGISTLGDLHNAVRARGRPHFTKIHIADHLPNSPGVYLFKGKEGNVLYVGKSKDLRSRVKSYFYGDSRKKIENLLAEVHEVHGIPCPTELEALVHEARLIQQHEPKYNRRGKTWRRYAYLKVDTSEAYPRIKVVYELKPGAATVHHIGPFRSSSQARLCKEALEEAFPIRRCTKSMGATTRFAPCALADMGRCLAPCDGRVDRETYGGLIASLLDELTTPDAMLERLTARMDLLAGAERFEEAALARDRLHALAGALQRRRADTWLLGPNRLVLSDSDGRRLAFRGGSLAVGRRGDDFSQIPHPVPRERADELTEVRRWLAKHPDVRLIETDAPLAEPVNGGAALHRLKLMFARSDRAQEDRSAR